jgi:hypothetical protein
MAKPRVADNCDAFTASGFLGVGALRSTVRFSLTVSILRLMLCGGLTLPLMSLF